MSLPLIYRPVDFHEVVGNAATVDSIKSVLSRPKEDIPHSWLITGPSGCGKTTLGRIVAAKLGCKGSDYYEVDSADFRGIDTIREIRKMMQYRPMESACRVWLLDECHQLSKDGQSALLKALEDTPPHVYFILCTTDPQKLLPTIKGRCAQFAVQALSDGEIVMLLKEVSEAEGKSVPTDILKQIARDSLGSSRNALQTLDKIIDLSPEKMSKAAEQESAKENAVIDLCRAVIKKEKWSVVAGILKGLEQEDPEQIRLAVMGYCKSVLLSGDSPRAFLIMDAFREPFYNNGMAGVVHACYMALEA